MQTWLAAAATTAMWVAIAAWWPATAAADGSPPTTPPDADTMQQELPTLHREYEAICGRTPRHGQAWLAQRASRLQPLAATDAAARVELIDTLRQLGRLEEARAEAERFTSSGANHPDMPLAMVKLLMAEGRIGEAQTMARDLQAAAGQDSGAGAGESAARFAWLARDLAWKVRSGESTVAGDARDLLGRVYLPLTAPELSDADYDALVWLVEQPETSPDAVLVLGDALWQRGNLNMAVYAWVRAKRLEHPQTAAIQHRLDAVWAAWVAGAEATAGRRVESRETAMNEIESELVVSHDWLDKLWLLEADLIKRGDNVDDLAVSAVLLKRIGILPHWPRDHGIRDDRILSVGGWILTIGWITASVLFLVVIVTLVRRRFSTAAPGHPSPDSPALPG